jgi:hypothetical protein
VSRARVRRSDLDDGTDFDDPVAREPEVAHGAGGVAGQEGAEALAPRAHPGDLQARDDGLASQEVDRVVEVGVDGGRDAG